MSDIHRSAAQGYAASAAKYVQGRPDYPAEVDDWLRSELALGPGKVVLDLGAGTGKFVPHLLQTGASVVAVEPIAAMLAQLVQLNRGVEAKQGSAETIPLAAASVDAVVCAQSFHWFANQDALAEIRRVLKPGGALGLIWNIRDERIAWVAELRRTFEPHAGDAPRFHTQAWRKVFPATGFDGFRERQFPHGHTGSPQHVILDRVLSTSFIAALSTAQRQRIAEDVWKLISETSELAGKTEVTMPYVTAAYSWRKVG
jgi:SAM-dependent methyltransferase